MCNKGSVLRVCVACWCPCASCTDAVKPLSPSLPLFREEAEAQTFEP